LIIGKDSETLGPPSSQLSSINWELCRHYGMYVADGFIRFGHGCMFLGIDLFCLFHIGC